TAFAESIREPLRQNADLERLISKVAVNRINPRELLQLKRSLKCIGPIGEALLNDTAPALRKMADQRHPGELLRQRIDLEPRDVVPVTDNQGGLIREGVDGELDELSKIAFS